MPTCPQASSLPQFCVGGQFSPAACEQFGTPDLRAQVKLVDADGNTPANVTDPNTCLTYIPVTSESVFTGADGCWCVCLPFANFSSVDPLRAANPSTTSWQISLFSGEADTGTWNLIGNPVVFQLDADNDYSVTCGDCAPFTTECGDCIPINCLIDPTGNLPTTMSSAFCDLVTGCMQDTVDGLQAQIDNLPPDTNTTNTSVAVAVSADGQSLGLTLTDSDGGEVSTDINCADINTVLQTCNPDEPPQEFVYADYDSGTHQAGAIAGVGSVGDPFQIPIPDSVTALVFQYVAYNPTTHNAGSIAGVGTSASPYQIPIPADPCSVQVTSGGTVFTGSPVGTRTFSCGVVAMPTETIDTVTVWDPEALYPAEDFPTGWEQTFTDAFSGTEIWAILEQLDGVTKQWVQVSQ